MMLEKLLQQGNRYVHAGLFDALTARNKGSSSYRSPTDLPRNL